MNKYHLYFLREDEWKMLTDIAEAYEEIFAEDQVSKDELKKQIWYRVYVFNHIAKPNVEDMTKRTDKFIEKGVLND